MTNLTISPRGLGDFLHSRAEFSVSSGGPHLRSVYPRMESYCRCNNCGKEGHFGKDCPSLARVVARPPMWTPTQHQQRNRGNRL